MIRTLLSATALFTLATASAYALTITNRDSAEALVTVDKGAVEVVHKIAPGATVTEPCPDVCGVRVAEGTGSDHLARDDAKLVVKDKRVTPQQ